MNTQPARCSTITHSASHRIGMTPRRRTKKDYALMNAVVKRLYPELSVRDKYVYEVLAEYDYPNQEGYCKGFVFPSIDKIASDYLLSVSSVYRALRVLKSKGLIRVRRRQNSSPCIYLLDVPEEKLSTFASERQMSKAQIVYKDTETIRNVANRFEFLRILNEDTVARLVAWGYDERQAARDYLKYGVDELYAQLSNLSQIIAYGVSVRDPAKWLNWAIRCRKRIDVEKLRECAWLRAAPKRNEIEERGEWVVDEANRTCRWVPAVIQPVSSNTPQTKDAPVLPSQVLKVIATVEQPEIVLDTAAPTPPGLPRSHQVCSDATLPFRASACNGENRALVTLYRRFIRNQCYGILNEHSSHHTAIAALSSLRRHPLTFPHAALQTDVSEGQGHGRLGWWWLSEEERVESRVYRIRRKKKIKFYSGKWRGWGGNSSMRSGVEITITPIPSSPLTLFSPKEKRGYWRTPVGRTPQANCPCVYPYRCAIHQISPNTTLTFPERGVLMMKIRRINDDARASEEHTTEPTHARQRKERSDKGTLRFTPRDEWVLRWIGEMMVVREDQLQVLLGRDAQRVTQQEGMVSLGTVARVITRWEKAALVGVDRAFAQTPRYVWLTLKAQRDVGLPYKKTFEPERKALLRHYYFVNQARLYVEAKFGDTIRWVSERELFRRKEHIDGHYVDGQVEFADGGVTAVEIEATVKPVERTRKAMLALAEHYDTVTYFVLRNTRTSVERRIAELPGDMQDVFQVIALEE